MSKAKNTFLRFKKQIFEILGVVSLLLIWEFFAIIYNNQEIVPGLGRIFLACFDLLSMKEVYLAFGETLLRTIFAIIISFIIGTVLGLLSGLFEGLRHYLKPIIEFIKLIPTPCIVFLILVFFLKSPNVGSLIITFIVVFPIILVSLYAVNIPPIKDDKLEKYVATISTGTYMYATEKSFFIKNENINGKTAILPKTIASNILLKEL